MGGTEKQSSLWVCVATFSAEIESSVRHFFLFTLFSFHFFESDPNGLLSNGIHSLHSWFVCPGKWVFILVTHGGSNKLGEGLERERESEGRKGWRWILLFQSSSVMSEYIWHSCRVFLWTFFQQLYQCLIEKCREKRIRRIPGVLRTIHSMGESSFKASSIKSLNHQTSVVVLLLPFDLS